MRHTHLVLFCLALVACGAPSAEDPPTLGESLRISGQMALEPCTDCPDISDDATSFQTPSGLRVGVAWVELLRSADDPMPVRIVSAAPPQDADLVAGATFADVDVGAVPEGVYTHVRVELDWVRFTVAATAHDDDLALPGTVDVDYVTSTHVSEAGVLRKQGDYVATFSALGQSFPQSGSAPVEYPPPYPNSTVAVAGELYRVTLPAPEQPIEVSHEAPQSVDVSVTFFIAHAFGWIDLDEPAYRLGVWDIATEAAQSEKPERMVIEGFAMDVRDSTTP
jgi:hypothetical protein